MKHNIIKVSAERTVTVADIASRANVAARSLKGAILRCNNLPLYHRELSGVIGQNEFTSQLYCPLAPSVEPREGWKEAIDAALALVPDTMTAVEALREARRLGAVAEQYMGEVDSRRTPAEDAEQVREREAWRAERVRVCDEAIARRSNGETRTRANSQMAIVLNLTYDDSDPMTDYYCPHAHAAGPWLLALVPKRPKTERLFREIVSHYIDLAAMPFTWHSENYSRGHGNYLQGTHCVTEGERVCSWEITADAWERNPIACYAGYSDEFVAK